MTLILPTSLESIFYEKNLFLGSFFGWNRVCFPKFLIQNTWFGVNMVKVSSVFVRLSWVRTWRHFLIPDFLGFGAPKWIFPTKIQNRIVVWLPYFVLVTLCMWGSQGTTLAWTKTQCSCNTVAIVKRNLTTCIKKCQNPVKYNVVLKVVWWTYLFL